MKYLCLVYAEESMFDQIPQEEIDRLEDESLAHDEELRQSGHLILAQALHSVDQAVTLRVRDGRLSSTDGPFAETTEQLGGFVFIEARDLNEAIQLASRIPMARYGTIEVRPEMDLVKKVSERPGG